MRFRIIGRSVTLGLTLLNALFAAVWLLHDGPSLSAAEPLPVLRGRALEIVDDQGRVRASITIHGPSKVDGVEYPETVLLRLTDPTIGPAVKITASPNGSALGLSDDADGGIQLYARDTSSVIRITGKDGIQRMINP